MSDPATRMEQRVGNSPTEPADTTTDRAETSCPTIIPFASPSPPPGRRALPPGGDNVTYSRAAHSSISEPARTDAPRADTPHNNALVTSASENGELNALSSIAERIPIALSCISEYDGNHWTERCLKTHGSHGIKRAG